MTGMYCRGCGTHTTTVFLDLGTAPLSNAFLEEKDLGEAESRFPLTVYVCESCLLVQLPAFEAPENIFSDYAYFSSFSDSWLAHAQAHRDSLIARYDLQQGRDRIVEIASNDGYLLRYYKQSGFEVLGIEPAANVAEAAKHLGIPTLVRFFGQETAKELVERGIHADLLVANNVLAHVPDLNGFIAGVSTILAGNGVATFEFPHLLRLMEENQFDTIYHEHFCYFSLHALLPVFGRHGLRATAVEELSTHGGSLRLHIRHEGVATPDPTVERVLTAERDAGLNRIEGYRGFQARVERIRDDFLSFLKGAKADGLRVVAYGAPAKGNTLLNYCAVTTDLLPYTVDRNPHKQGRYLPGSRIPIAGPEKIDQDRPDVLLILPWNLKDEIRLQMGHIRDWGGRFAVPIPEAIFLE